MRQAIHFRSKVSSSQRGDESLKKIQSHGSEYESIRPATPSDDARDIAWKQSARSDILSVKSREDTTRLNVMLIGASDTSWGFSIETWDDKYAFYRTLANASRTSSNISWYKYEEHFYTHTSIEKICSDKKKDRIKNALILFVVSDLDTPSYHHLDSLWRQNDIIVIHLLHPYEKNPEKYPNILTESSQIKHREYQEALIKIQKDIKSVLIHAEISFLQTSSTDNPIKLLNHFFKHRYAH